MLFSIFIFFYRMCLGWCFFYFYFVIVFGDSTNLFTENILWLQSVKKAMRQSICCLSSCVCVCVLCIFYFVYVFQCPIRLLFLLFSWRLLSSLSLFMDFFSLHNQNIDIHSSDGNIDTVHKQIFIANMAQKTHFEPGYSSVPFSNAANQNNCLEGRW